MAPVSRLLFTLGTMALSSSVHAQETNTKESCTVAGITWYGIGKYLTGKRHVYGSIFADCDNGVPTCYLDEGMSDDYAHQQVPCEDAVLKESHRKLGVYLEDKDNLWPKGIACYDYATAFSAKNQELMSSAMNEYKEKAGIQFIHINNCSSTYGNDEDVCGGCKVKFTIKNDESGCFARIGYSKRSKLYLNVELNECDRYRTYLHELGHVLGLEHEHVHPDRKVVILRKNVGSDYDLDKFEKDNSSAVTPYDPTSIMHYQDDSICWPKDTTINYCDVNQSERDGCVVPTEKDCDLTRKKSIKKSEHLSAGDIQTIQKMYGTQSIGGEGTDLSVITRSSSNATEVPSSATEAPPNATEAPPVPKSTKPKCRSSRKGKKAKH
jgi:hypothetical protein